MKRHSSFTHAGIKGLALLLAAMMVIGMVACNDPQTPAETDTETEVSTNQTETDTDTATDTDTETETDTTTETDTGVSAVEGVSFPSEGGVIVLSDYAASWEISAANLLKNKLDATAIVSEDITEYDFYRVVVGYTSLNDELGADFDTIGDLGYMIKAEGDTVLIIANTEAGMNDALTAFEGSLGTDILGDPAIPYGVITETKNSETETEKTYEAGWDENIDYALGLQNGIQTHFTDANRTKWTLQNKNVILNYDLSDKNCYASITNLNGVPYVINTGYVYLVDTDGQLWSTEGSKDNASFNIYEMGYYYNNTHIRGLDFGRNTNFAAFRLDTTLHMYSDKLNVVQHLVSTLPSGTRLTGLAGYGQYYEIDASRVLQFVAKDANGTHYSYDEVDWDTAEYVAFDIDRAGIFGVILLTHENSGKITVTLEDGVYTVDQRNAHDPEAYFSNSFHLYFGQRLYTDDSHDFTAFINEAEAERNPLTRRNLGGLFLSYDALRGAYKGSMPTVPWGNPQQPNDYKLSKLILNGDELDRKFYYYTDCGFGALECAVMMDENMRLLPIALEVTKNFGGENEEPLYDPTDWHYGNTYVPVTLNAGEKKEFTLIGLNFNWGNTPLKQLSSIQFFKPYYHLSLGPWESNCIAPDGTEGKDFWTLPDFRPVGTSGAMKGDQYWAQSIIKILQYTDTDGVSGSIENYHDHIDSYGPVYADITMDYLSTDGRLDVSYRHVELPNEDENRTLYSIRIKINEDITFEDFNKDFVLFAFTGRGLQYGTLSYLDENNEVVRQTILENRIENGRDTVTGELFRHEQYVVLGNGAAPYFGYYNAVNYDIIQSPNFALILKDWDIVIGGETFDGNFLLHDYLLGGTTNAQMTINIDGEVTLKAGDYINIDMILMPWGRQYAGTDNPAENDNSIQNVRQDTVIDPFTITAKKGEVIKDVYIPKIHVDNNGVAEFTVAGGASNGVVRVYGLTSYAKPVIKYVVDGKWKVYDNASSKGYDGYMVYAEADGTYSVAFAFNMDNVGEEGYTFRVTAGE